MTGLLAASLLLPSFAKHLIPRYDGSAMRLRTASVVTRPMPNAALQPTASTVMQPMANKVSQHKRTIAPGGRRELPISVEQIAPHRGWSRRRVAGLLCFLVLVITCGCRPSAPAASSEKPTSSPQRIIALAPSSVEIIAALDASDRLVAIGSFCHYPPEVTKLPKVGGLFDPDLEAVLRLRPDLIVMRGENKELRRLCEDGGISIYEDSTEALGDIFRTINEFGKLLDCQERAEQLSRAMRGELDRITKAVTGRPRPRVLFVIGRRSPESLASIITASNGTFVQEMIEYAGGENVFANLAIEYPEVSLEGILSAQPEVVFDAMPESEPSDALDARIKAQWRQLGAFPAVEHDRIYVLTDDALLTPSHRVVRTISRLAKLLHPEANLD